MPTYTQVAETDKKLMECKLPNDPIVHIYERFDKCQAVTRAVNTLFTKAQLIQKVNILIEQTGVYHDQLIERECKPEIKKTRAKCQLYWLKKYLDRSKRPTTTRATSGYNPLKNLVETKYD